MACPGIKVCHHLGALVAVLLHLCGELILRLLFKQNQLRHTPGGEATGEATVIAGNVARLLSFAGKLVTQRLLLGS